MFKFTSLYFCVFKFVSLNLCFFIWISLYIFTSSYLHLYNGETWMYRPPKAKYERTMMTSCQNKSPTNYKCFHFEIRLFFTEDCKITKPYQDHGGPGLVLKIHNDVKEQYHWLHSCKAGRSSFFGSLLISPHTPWEYPIFLTMVKCGSIQ